MKPAQVRFTFAQAAAISGIKLVTLNSMFLRKQMFFGRHEMTPAPRRGAPKQLTFAGLFKVAILAHLLKLGMPPTRAWQITMSFTETGGQPIRGRRFRLPGHLFEHGPTFLVAGDDGVGRVMNLHPLVEMESNVVTVVVNLTMIKQQIEKSLFGTDK